VNQFTRNIFGGIGIGYFSYDSRELFPLYLYYRHSFYFKAITPFLNASGGLLVALQDMDQLTKIFINPGIGVNRSVSSHFELNLSTGINVQMGYHIGRARFVNIKLGIIFRKNPL
jgi:hypothetical protein